MCYSVRKRAQIYCGWAVRIPYAGSSFFLLLIETPVFL